VTGLTGEARGPIRIAIDAMGGENAPGVEVAGGIAAARDSGGAVEVVLVGKEDLVGEALAGQDHEGLSVSIVDAPETIEMGDSPASAVRRKRGASIVVATELQKRGEVDGLVSAGNTGAVVASSLLGLGMLPNVRRPAIASLFPTAAEPAIVVDVGASIDSRPADLLEFAAMGEVLSSHLLGRENPRVALLNIGEEPTKGSQLTVEAYGLLNESPLNFVGNVEGRNFLQGEADVVVCDGFVGNIVLKLVEGVRGMLQSALRDSGLADDLSSFVSQFDYSEYGGAPLLGANGVVIISHGASSPKAIKNAVKVAAGFVEADMESRLVERLREVGGADGQ
jgi:glycerol-3-phosphate acyltransferase PlsX